MADKICADFSKTVKVALLEISSISLTLITPKICPSTGGGVVGGGSDDGGGSTGGAPQSFGQEYESSPPSHMPLPQTDDGGGV